MPRVDIPFAKQTYQERSRPLLNERLVNMYLQAAPQGSKKQSVLYGTPGLTLFASVGDGPIRGMIYMDPYLYVVSGTSLYTVDSSGVSVEIGTVKRTGYVNMAVGNGHILIATSRETYAANDTEILQLPDSYIGGVAYLDGYGLLFQQKGQNFWVTAIDDMTSVNALDYTTVDKKTDEIISGITESNTVWVFKERTIELFQHTGAAFPFSRSHYIETGLKSQFSVAYDNGVVFWLGHDLRVYAAQGYQPRAISTPVIDELISNRNSPQTAKGFLYTQEGHTFYVLSFSDKTFVYDLTTGLWHERESIDCGGRWRINDYSYCWNKHLGGDYSNGNLYTLELDTYTENGSTIFREAITPPLYSNGEWMEINELYLSCEVGVGLISGQGSEPKAMVSYTDDAGRTWSNQYDVSIGEVGDYDYIPVISALGSSRERHFKIRISDPVKIALIGAEANIEVSQ